MPDNASNSSKKRLIEVLTKVWKEVKDNLPEEELDKDEVWMWWPTLIHTEPNYEAIADNLLSFSLNPYVCMLTVFYYGYARAMDDMMQEKVFPTSQFTQGNNRLPEWLDQAILDDLEKRFGGLH